MTRLHSTVRVRPSTGRLRASCVATLMALALTAPPLMSQEKKAPAAERNKQAQVDKPASEDQDDPVRLRADLVVVSVTVTDATGQYAHGLSGKDFIVLEDSAPQAVNTFSAEEAPFAAAILIDMSGSMEYKFGLVRGAAASFLDHIRENDQVAVYGFNDKVRQLQDFSSVRDITDYLWDAKAENMTRLYDCMDEAVTALVARQEKRRAVLLISDGWDSTSHKASLDSVMKKSLAAGVTIYTIDLIDDDTMRGSSSTALSLQRGRSDMKEFADKTGGRYVRTPQGDKLEEAFTNIVDELRNQYTLTYYSTNTKKDGRWRKLSIGLRKDGLTARSRRGYWAAK
ncbi:MAG TPA: VWA domain-containing protein [Blastocatellia bacterium]|nr:VWA domain-containing protein [Blastocatellia bacterium]